MRLVAAAASVLFVLVLGGEILFGGRAGMIASAPAENATFMQESDEMESDVNNGNLGSLYKAGA